MFTKKPKLSIMQIIFWPIYKWQELIHQNHIVNEAVENLILKSSLKPKFFVMSLLSGIMATIGILLNDIAILIAAMVLAPLLNPLIALAAGMVLGHLKLIGYAIKSFIGGTISVIFFTALFTRILLFLHYDLNINYFAEKFTNEQNLFLLIAAAFISGFAAVYSWLKSDKTGNNLVGVAIAVSLVPLFSFLGILLGLQKTENFFYFAGWLGINLLSLVFGAVTSLIILGFKQPKAKINKEISQAEKKGE